jgi:hypothetical protein
MPLIFYYYLLRSHLLRQLLQTGGYDAVQEAAEERLKAKRELEQPCKQRDKRQVTKGATPN